MILYNTKGCRKAWYSASRDTSPFHSASNSEILVHSSQLVIIIVMLSMIWCIYPSRIIV
uniref:Uncharacterized protein n=1 Tax=Arundo donax TaxID=35708 RepID=A0A0A9ERF9_ARUDO